VVAVDFLMHGTVPGAREAEAASIGAKVYHVPYRRDDPAGNRRGIEQAVLSGYDVVHAHMDGMNAYPLGIAKRFGISVRISHSHNTDFLTANPARRAFHMLARVNIPRVATHLFACSAAAGRFLYGGKRIQSGNVKIIRNAIDIDRYRFDSEVRARMRSELGLDGSCAIGHIGRFDLRQKNQLFLLDAFSKAKKNRPELKLVLIGDGEGRIAIERHIGELQLDGEVMLTGFRDDIPDLLCAMDVFALPSHFEGLGIVLIEAQANGLPCVASSAVPQDTLVTDCTYLALTDMDGWVRFFANIGEKLSRTLEQDAFAAKGYDIRLAAKALSDFYLEVASR
jgi:glycosyltransferase involved in cell wall biosynthesis